MRHTFHAAILLLSTVTVNGQEPPKDADLTPAIATSGDVEIVSIRTVRERAADAAKDADLNHLEVVLWLTSQGDRTPGRPLVKIADLDPILDDTGKLLLTKQRRAQQTQLHEELLSAGKKIGRGKGGPVVVLTLDLPERKALKIPLIKGKATVAQPSVAKLDFKDLSKLRGQPLEHPKLKNFKIEATFEFEDGVSMLTVRLPKKHAKVEFWGLIKDGRILGEEAELRKAEDETTVSFKKIYPGDRRKDSFFGIMITESTEPRTLEFQFKDVELP